MSMYDELLFSDRLGRLDSRETDYWRMIFSKVLKVGEEYEVEIPRNRDIDEMVEEYRGLFRPTRSVDHVGEYGIYDVTTDGSVRNGIELITVGRRFDWNVFYDMNKTIMDTFRGSDFNTSHHTGMHIHLLAGYTSNGTSELERAVPEIILANFYQLHKIFAPELYWIASGGTTDYALTRYVLFRRPPFEYSAVSTPMEQIKNSMSEKYGKYQMFNMERSRIYGRNVERFHVEIRHPDTHLSPAYSSALVALEVAMLKKAIDLSQCGIISIKNESIQSKKILFDKFVNLGIGDRDSDSSELTQEDIEKLQVMTSNMVRWFKSEIISISSVAYDILQKIAVKPSSLRRIEGKSWRQIDEDIYSPKMMDSDKKNNIVEMIILHQIIDCRTVAEWKKKVSDRLEIPMQKTSELINLIGKERFVVWDKELGSMMFKQII
jgi:hypothetical protein